MVAADFLLQDPRVQGWLDGVEPAWTLLTFESLLALRHEPSAVQSAIQDRQRPQCRRDRRLSGGTQYPDPPGTSD
jgi:hypothetical protein